MILLQLIFISSTDQSLASSYRHQFNNSPPTFEEVTKFSSDESCESVAHQLSNRSSHVVSPSCRLILVCLFPSCRCHNMKVSPPVCVQSPPPPPQDGAHSERSRHWGRRKMMIQVLNDSKIFHSGAAWLNWGCSSLIFYYYLWLLFITEQQLWSQHQCCYYNDKRRANCCCQHRLQLSQHTADCVTHTHMQPHTHTHTHTQWTVSSSLLMQKNICTSCFFFLPETLRTCFAKIIMMLNYCWIFNVDLIWWRHVGSILVPLTWTEVQYWSKWTLLLVSRLTRCCPLLAGGDTAAEAGQVKWTCECLHVSPGIIIQLSYLSWFIVFILFGHT